jgi:hypothetical protein
VLHFLPRFLLPHLGVSSQHRLGIRPPLPPSWRSGWRGPHVGARNCMGTNCKTGVRTPRPSSRALASPLVYCNFLSWLALHLSPLFFEQIGQVLCLFHLLDGKRTIWDVTCTELHEE